jgi:hypothetical protein
MSNYFKTEDMGGNFDIIGSLIKLKKKVEDIYCRRIPLGNKTTFLEVTENFNSENSIENVIFPKKPILGDTTVVKFGDGIIANYTFQNNEWIFNFVNNDLTNNEFELPYKTFMASFSQVGQGFVCSVLQNDLLIDNSPLKIYEIDYTSDGPYGGSFFKIVSQNKFPLDKTICYLNGSPSVFLMSPNTYKEYVALGHRVDINEVHIPFYEYIIENKNLVLQPTDIYPYPDIPLVIEIRVYNEILDTFLIEQ